MTGLRTYSDVFDEVNANAAQIAARVALGSGVTATGAEDGLVPVDGAEVYVGGTPVAWWMWGEALDGTRILRR